MYNKCCCHYIWIFACSLIFVNDAELISKLTVSSFTVLIFTVLTLTVSIFQCCLCQCCRHSNVSILKHNFLRLSQSFFLEHQSKVLRSVLLLSVMLLSVSVKTRRDDSEPSTCYTAQLLDQARISMSHLLEGYYCQEIKAQYTKRKFIAW